jgi:hypothetical protein
MQQVGGARIDYRRYTLEKDLREVLHSILRVSLPAGFSTGLLLLSRRSQLAKLPHLKYVIYCSSNQEA